MKKTVKVKSAGALRNSSELIIAAVKATVNTNGIIPIMEDIHFGSTFIEVTDLETTVSIPYNSGIEACVPAVKFLKAFEMMDDPELSVSCMSTPEENEEPFVAAITVSQGQKKIKLSCDNPDSFPLLPIGEKDQFNQIGVITEEYMGYLRTALKFVSDDDLRPAMTGIYFCDHIVSTDAHRLYWKPIDAFLESLIVPAKTIKILQVFGGPWDVYYSGTHGIFINEAGVEVYFRAIDANYPQYRAVIPEGNGNLFFAMDPKALRSEVKAALNFANKGTNCIHFSFNGSNKIGSQDVDMGYEYSNELEGAKVIKQKELNIGLNGRFLDQILAEIPKGELVKAKMWEPNRCVIINNQFLIMPFI